MKKSELRQIIRKEINEYHFTKSDIHMLRADLLKFVSNEKRKLGYDSSIDTYKFMLQVMHNADFFSKLKGLK